jgi:hypothetical protein
MKFAWKLGTITHSAVEKCEYRLNEGSAILYYGKGAFEKLLSASQTTFPVVMFRSESSIT